MTNEENVKAQQETKAAWKKPDRYDHHPDTRTAQTHGLDVPEDNKMA
jgi:hypothetical protein